MLSSVIDAPGVKARITVHFDTPAAVATSFAVALLVVSRLRIVPPTKMERTFHFGFR
ncbi:hypothetical protein AGR7A_Lc120032 [Agrobacterium deltaense NCPPB 1641]|uniref:Uncharacterized protein n=1 Tax=Agrobacterium deltaense NCPPB 1641 TaxID=1183425 RepID=A0A1S7TUP1_9HYPH|nr:hypothetical protein AGR7A_Lc120032 [Agrobacterium deltaense NCPPB 1641]